MLTNIATIYYKIKKIELVTPPSSFGATKNSIFKVIDVQPAVINYPASAQLIANSKLSYWLKTNHINGNSIENLITATKAYAPGISTNFSIKYAFIEQPKNVSKNPKAPLMLA